MPRVGSNDVRERVVQAVQTDASCRFATLHFGVAPSRAIK